MPQTKRHRQNIKWLSLGAIIVLSGYGLAHRHGSASEPAGGQGATTSSSQVIHCDQVAYSLDELVECISDHMPQDGSEGFVPPPASVQSDWRTVVEELVAIDDISECDDVAIPASLSGIYDVFGFYDAFDDRDYCVAMEIQDADEDEVVDRGWGTLIVNPDPARRLSIDIPHPLEDKLTNLEGIAIYKGVQAHTFVMAGSNRYANAQASCQSGEVISDMAHSTEGLFLPAVVEIDQHHADAGHEHTAIQFHGMSKDGCEDVEIYITHGSEDAPQAGDSIVTLKHALLAIEPSWDVANPGEPGALCGKNGTNNIPGRYLNSGDESLVCGSDVDTYNGRFIHVEQDPDGKLSEFRNPAIWIEALRNTFAPITPPPAMTSISFQDGVAPDPSYGGAIDTWIDADDPDDNFGPGEPDKGEFDCQVDFDEKAIAMRWDVSAIPAGSTVDEVMVTLNVTSKTKHPGYYVYPLARDWTEDGATWNEFADAMPWQTPGALGAMDRAATPVAKWVPLTTGTQALPLSPAVVQSWLDAPSTNRGIIVATNDANSDGLDFRCRETSVAADRPRLTVVYH